MTGTTVIFVNGNMNVAGDGIANQSQIPSNLQIYLLGSWAHYSGTSDFYGVLYGPSTDIDFSGDASVYGAAVGKTVDFNASGTGAPSGIHVDESLDRLLHVRPRAFLVQ